MRPYIYQGEGMTTATINGLNPLLLRWHINTALKGPLI
jgi:hypothetical protein